MKANARRTQTNALIFRLRSEKTQILPRLTRYRTQRTQANADLYITSSNSKLDEEGVTRCWWAAATAISSIAQLAFAAFVRSPKAQGRVTR